MTVSELIEVLKELPQDDMVVVRGYEGGVDEVVELEQAHIALNVNEEWSYGAHELLDPRDGTDGDDVVSAIYLRGE